MTSRHTMRRFLGIAGMSSVVLILLLADSSAAQGPKPFAPSANPVTDSVRSALAKQAKNLIASAELMPPDKYGYQPTPAQMTFGALIAHVVQTNVAICSAFSAVDPPLPPEALKQISGSDSKTALVAAVKQSFDFCSASLAKLEDAGLREEALMFGRPTSLSRAEALITIAVDWADHYSTAASYLRLNGILPPSAPPAGGRKN